MTTEARLSAQQLSDQLHMKMRAIRVDLRKQMGLIAYGEASRRAQLIIRRVMVQNRMDILEAASKLCARADDRGDADAARLVCAAAMDMLEPEDKPLATTVLHA
jgi:hypothetical protein